jgi:hypothetical protein
MAKEKILIHYYHSLKVTILAVVRGGGGGYRNFMPSFHTNRLPSPLFTHHFIFFHHHLHALIYKTYFVQVRLLDSLIVHSTELNSYGRSYYTIQTRQENPAKNVSRSLPNLSAGRLARLFLEAPGI